VHLIDNIEVPQESVWHLITGSVVLTFATVGMALLVRWFAA
jgi:hypothetical protein